MATISFFCTRCRRLATFPASRRGAIVYCPSCRQALIAPDIPTRGDKEDGGDDESWQDGQGAQNGGNGAFASTASWSEAEQDEGALLNDKRWGKDGEFETPRRLAAAIPPPPVAPPVLWAPPPSEESATKRSGTKRFWSALGVATLGGAAFVGGAFWATSAKNGEENDATSVKQSVAEETFFLEGALTYRTANGANAPDDGAFVFLFPSEERFGAPIALGNVSPQHPTPSGFESVVAELEERGARFAVADFEGRFAFENLEPGEYRVLLVSRRVGDDWREANALAIKEIERCVVSPRLLLGNNRFFWTTRRFDRDSATFEKSFGKAGAPFSNVD